MRIIFRWAPVVGLVFFGIGAFAPELFFGKAFLGEEQIGFYYAISHYVSSSLQQGAPMLWQSGYYGGVSASLDQFVGAFYPLNLFLFSVLPMFVAHHLSIIIATVAGLLFAYWFGRLQGWRRSSSMVLALGYFSATTYGWLQIGTIAAHSFAMLPALLVAVYYAQTSGYRRAIAIFGGGAFLAIGLLAGFVQIVFYAYCVAGAYGLFLDYEAYDRSKPWWRSLPATFSFVAITGVGLIVASRQFFPSAYLINETIRTSTYAIQNAFIPSPTELVAFILPPYLSIPFISGGHSSGFYVGALGLIFALLGLRYYRTRASLFFAGLYALIVCFAFHLPGFGWLNEHMPPFSHMGGNFRWMVGAALPLAYLTAAGVDGFLREPSRIPTRGYRVVLWASALVAAALVLGALSLQVLAGVFSSPQWIDRIILWYSAHHHLVYPLDHYRGVLEQAVGQISSTFSLMSLPFLFGTLCWVAALLFFVCYRTRPNVQYYAPHTIATLTFLTVFGTVVLQWSDLAPQSVYAEVPALVSLMQSREQDPRSYRIMGLLVGDGVFNLLTAQTTLTPEDATRLQHEELTNNTNLFYGLQRKDGLEPYRTLRANQLIDTVVAPGSAAWAFDDQSPALETSPLDQLYNRDVQKEVTITQKLEDFSTRIPLISMMNVKYVYLPYQLSNPRLQKVGEVLLPATGGLKLYVYQNRGVLPRTYFAQKPEFFSGTQNELLQKVAHEQDFAAHTWIECASCAASSTLNHLGSGGVVVSRYKDGFFQATTTSTTGGWVVFSESALPGWQASIDGAPAPIYTANYLFQAVYVPKGVHTVRFVYRDITMLKLEALLH